MQLCQLLGLGFTAEFTEISVPREEKFKNGDITVESVTTRLGGIKKDHEIILGRQDFCHPL